MSTIVTQAEPRKLPLLEFTVMLAMLFATIAFSIDAMLPALDQIAAELSPDAVNRAQLVITSFVLGMGLGTAFAGPISDATGRKPAIYGGFLLYIAGSVMAHYAPSLGWLLAARVVQGLGAAGPRIVGLALVRDLYEGREMARITSFAMTIFMIVPAAAPSLGALIIAAAGWRAVFLAFVIFGLIGMAWVGARQPETLPAERRRPLRATTLTAALREVLADREVRICTAAMTLGFGQMLGLLSSAPQIFGEVYGQGATFPYWFAGLAGLAALAPLLNARLVMHVGMRRLATVAYAAQTLFSLVVVALFLTGAVDGFVGLILFFLWAASVFFMAGLTFGNLNAIALQRMGHIAGMAASVISAISTVLATVIASPIGQAFDGSPLPVMAGVIACSAAAWGLTRRMVPH